MGDANGNNRRRFDVRRGLLYGLLGGGALASLLAARPITAAVREGAFHGWHGRGGHGHMDPAALREHLGVAVKWGLRDVDATDEQQARVSAILSGAADDLLRLRDQHHAQRAAFHAALGADTVDRAELERLRKSTLALAEEASQRLVQAAADAADVLTPEQRRALLERHAERHGHRR